ncbi:hypothetical protein AB0O82_32760 [Kitasatospora sp. NPDC088264]|uniref:hypothetical protein n=1 Tax=Kitasatospora sp. NPDC088264 TaxID=3155296 RepID=UPI00343A1EC1
MARRTLRTIPVHADGSTCDHKVNSRGKPKDPADPCTGRTGYKATCSCGWTSTKYLRLLADDDRAKHAATHTTTPAAAQAA